MKYILLLICLTICFPCRAASSGLVDEKKCLVVTIPYMQRAGSHRIYADKLLRLALELSKKKYGDYCIAQQSQSTVIRRQLLELADGRLSVAVSMPMPEWLAEAKVVQFPIMRGLASYRMFLSNSKNTEMLSGIDTLDELKSLKIGQGLGWSTGKILEANGFKVVYGGTYQTLFPMLNSDRFQLLMRGVYEIEPEIIRFESKLPNIYLVDDLALYTYLPMYFFVSPLQPELAERLEYGLKKAYETGQFNTLFYLYFKDSVALLSLKKRKVFYLSNTNIDGSYYEHDKRYLLDAIVELESGRPPRKNKRTQ